VERKSFAAMDCSVAQCLEVVGEWWSLLIIRDAFLGVTRFDDFQRRLGISRNILQQRLARLVDAGVLVRVPYSEHPVRNDYRLTDKGRDLWPVITTMRQWGDRYAAPSGPPVQVAHKACGSTSESVLVCGTCGEPLGARDVTAVPGAGRSSLGLSPHSGSKAGSTFSSAGQ
jgi:DNA-binding HxlR family transcriptional regulator